MSKGVDSEEEGKYVRYNSSGRFAPDLRSALRPAVASLLAPPSLTSSSLSGAGMWRHLSLSGIPGSLQQEKQAPIRQNYLERSDLGGEGGETILWSM